MDCSTTVAVIGVFGTLVGTAIGYLATYISEKNEHKRFIKRFRIERAFNHAENILSMIRDAELGSVEPEGKDKVYINHLLVDGVLFIAWYAKFVENWRPKQYLLDAKSIENCKALHNFLYPLGSIATEPLIRAEVLPLSVKFRSLLFACHESLEEYLLQGIEDA